MRMSNGLFLNLIVLGTSTNSTSEPDCGSFGLTGHTRDGTVVCCAHGCSQCGGSGCSGDCCTGHIIAQGRSCLEVGPPCLWPSTLPPTPSETGIPYRCGYSGGSNDECFNDDAPWTSCNIPSCDYAVEQGNLPSGTSCSGICEAPYVVKQDGSDLKRPVHIKISDNQNVPKYYLSSKDEGIDLELLETPSDRSAWTIHSSYGMFRIKNVRGASSGEHYLIVPGCVRHGETSDGCYAIELAKFDPNVTNPGDMWGGSKDLWDFRRGEATGKYVVQNRVAFFQSDGHRRRRRGSVLSTTDGSTVVAGTGLYSGRDEWTLEFVNGGGEVIV